MVPFRKGADGVVSHKITLHQVLCFDHPGCGAAVASQLFITAAATPPWQGGEMLDSNSEFVPIEYSQFHFGTYRRGAYLRNGSFS